MATAVCSANKSSDLVKDYMCGACEEKQFKESAEKYCKQCLKLFCVKCINLHDKLYEKHFTLGRGDINQWPLNKKTEDFLQNCEVHVGKKLEMFCEDHSQLCCTNCDFLIHRQCKSVSLISETVKKQSTDLQQLSDKIITILNEFKQLRTTIDDGFKSVEDSYSERLQEVRDVRQKLNAALDELEKKTLKEIEDTRSALLASLKTDLDNFNRLEDKLKQLSEAVLDLIVKSEQELSFIAGRKCLDMIQESKIYLNENSGKVQCSFLFQENTDIEQYLSKQSGLGKIGDPDQVITVKGKAEYNIKISSDSAQTCFITGMCCLASGQVIVADQRNKRVKLLNRQYEVIGHCEVSGTLWDLCHISSNEVAVTLVGQQYSVQFISVNNAQLVNGRHFQLQHDAVGIAHHKGALYVTSRTALYQYTLTGILVNKLYEDKYDNSVWKCALSPTGDKIHVNDYTRHKLLTLTRDGTLIYAFTDPELQLPYGVHVTPAGQILVCGESSKTIIQLDKEGRKKLATFATLTGEVSTHLSVVYNCNTDSVIVGFYCSNTILVFKVQ